MKEGFERIIKALEELPKEEDYKKAIKEAHVEYGTLTKGDLKEIKKEIKMLPKVEIKTKFSLKKLIKKLFKKNQ